MRRRTFLSLGLAGAAALSTAGWWARVRRSSTPTRGLDADARAIVSAIVPAMLDGALPSEASSTHSAIIDTVSHVDRAIAGLPEHARSELSQLFALLALPPARRAFAGVSAPWTEAGKDEVRAFLDDWRDSRWSLKRSAYDALHQLVMAAWYGNPRAWTGIGYPGPPSIG
ncbi:MAG TPA: hypothetical protein VNE58_05745 [Casimicrobiaceae bacterium]|nr:hypothetical protein [Casimicrobiaceae bacterium]